MIHLISLIIEVIISQLHNNQYLAAGCGTVIIGGLLAIFRNVPYKIYESLKSFLTIELTINTKNSCYNEVALFANALRINATSRTFSVARYRSSAIMETEKLPKDKKYNLVIGYGLSLAIYHNRLIILDKTSVANKNDIDDQLTITFLTRNRKIVNDFMDEATKDEPNDNISIFASQQDYWDSPIERSKRNMNTVFINENIKEELVNSIEKFKNNKSWYIDRGIPYKLCMCLYGKPGTGKTSLIHTIASKFNMNIRYISSLENISYLLDSDVYPKNDIIVIEDIDSLGNLDRTDDQKTSDKKVIHNLLNVLDGLKTREGMIIIMTTNHIDHLDPALKRSGRIDKMIEILSLDIQTMKQMFLAFYGQSHLKLIDKFVESGKYNPMTGAELQEIFLSDAPEQALERIKNGKV